MRPNTRRHDVHRVVIVGGGFGGLYLAKSLRREPVDVTLVDRRNFHLFQPLLYQVATGGLSPANIAAPLRSILKRQSNTRVMLGEVSGFDLVARRVRLADGATLEFDTLVVAAGAENSYFGNAAWSRVAPGLKSLEDATLIRRRVLSAFELAERESDPGRARRWLTFIVVGAGPTGVELAGALAEIARNTLRREFRNIEPADASILLVEAGDRVLATYPQELSDYAASALRRLGVTLRMRTRVVDVAADRVTLATGEVTESIAAHTVLWSAGVHASPLARLLSEQTGAELDRMGRVVVEPDCSLRGQPRVFVIGDMAHCRCADGSIVPGTCPAAMQQGRYVAGGIAARLSGRAVRPFQYHDKGSMATIGRASAIALIGRRMLRGYFAWLAWLMLHIIFLIEFQNRLLVLIQWAWNYFTWSRSARLIVGPADKLDEPPL